MVRNAAFDRSTESSKVERSLETVDTIQPTRELWMHVLPGGDSIALKNRSKFRLKNHWLWNWLRNSVGEFLAFFNAAVYSGKTRARRRGLESRQKQPSCWGTTSLVLKTLSTRLVLNNQWWMQLCIGNHHQMSSLKRGNSVFVCWAFKSNHDTTVGYRKICRPRDTLCRPRVKLSTLGTPYAAQGLHYAARGPIEGRGWIISPVGGIMWPVGGIFSRSWGRGGIITLLHGRADMVIIRKPLWKVQRW